MVLHLESFDCIYVIETLDFIASLIVVLLVLLANFMQLSLRLTVCIKRSSNSMAL